MNKDQEQKQEGLETYMKNGEETQEITKTNINNGDQIIHPKKGVATLIKKYTSGCQVQIHNKDKKDYIKWYTLTTEWKKLTTTQPHKPPTNQRRGEAPPDGADEGKEGKQETAAAESRTRGEAPKETDAKDAKEAAAAKRRRKDTQAGGAAAHRTRGEKEGEGGQGEEGEKEEALCPVCGGTGTDPYTAEGLPQDVQDDLNYAISDLLPRAVMIDRLQISPTMKQSLLDKITRHKHYVEEEKEGGGKKEDVPPASDKQLKLIGDLLKEIGYNKSVGIVLGKLNIEQAKNAIDDLFVLKKKQKGDD